MKWYVLHTKPRCEKKAEQQLLSMGIIAYCPTRTEMKLWSDRRKKVEVPAIPSIIFVQIDDKDLNRVFHASSIVKYMFWLGARAVVRQCEIDVIKNYIRGISTIKDKNLSNIKIGDNLNVSTFNNENGIIKRISKNNIWVEFDSTGYSVKLKVA